MQLGFVIDQTRCIGCHACTVACKSENDVPLGSFRTWVKYTEHDAYPRVRRHFTVLRCNQCSHPPCVTICPVRALEKRADGIVDVDPEQCIGCKACLQACPYDALYLHEDRGTVEKCHFCAHRVERGLAPACAVVCPTEAILPGDFDDPQSVVAQRRREPGAAVRKAEAGTAPNVFYVGADAAGLQPGLATARGGFLWAQQPPGMPDDGASSMPADTRERDALEERARPRVVYDVGHPPRWGGKVSGYLFTKSLAAGIPLAGLGVLPPWLALGALEGPAAAWVPGLGMLFLALTSILLVADLKRPERFLRIVMRPNWDSWLARGAFVLLAHGTLLAAWLLLALVRPPRVFEGGEPSALLAGLMLGGAATGVLAAAYTGWLFAQAHGRVLWMRRGLALHLVVQALVAGAALLLLLGPALGVGLGGIEVLRKMLVVGLVGHLGFTAVSARLAPARRAAEYARHWRITHTGRAGRRFWVLSFGLGIVVPLVLLTMLVPPAAHPAGALLALWGLWLDEDHLVRAGQRVAIS